MEDPANMRDPTKSSDEKQSFEELVTPASGWITSAAHLTRLLSKKLLAWGVEERGAYGISF